MRRVFVLTAEDVAREVPAYGNFVAEQISNFVEFPPELTGVPARVIALVGRWFPTGCHKVGATYGCLAPRLVTGRQMDRFHPVRAG